MLVFCKIETVFEILFATAISGFPSPFTSVIAIALGSSPVVKSTFVKLKLTKPIDELFLKTEIVAIFFNQQDAIDFVNWKTKKEIVF